MKRILLCLPLLALFASAFFGCTQQQQWNQEQRAAIRQALSDYRQMLYLEDLTDAEFALFTEGVATELENDYPIYTSFVQMPAMNDTVDMVVVTAIVQELNADARNMRHLYPYPYLVSQGMLPAGLDREQQRAFYNCFASKINATYQSVGALFGAMLTDTTNLSQIAQIERQCANDLFNWTVAEVEVIEAN